jgi:hypothetical protein
VATDLIDYGCPDSAGGIDFLQQQSAPEGAKLILTNPPYKHANAFVRRALTLVPRVYMLLRLLFLESQGRSDILEGGKLARVYVFRNRVVIHREGWPEEEKQSNPMALAWFVWDANHRGPWTGHRISWEPDIRAAAPPSDDLDLPNFLRGSAP